MIDGAPSKPFSATTLPQPAHPRTGCWAFLIAKSWGRNRAASQRMPQNPAWEGDRGVRCLVGPNGVNRTLTPHGDAEVGGVPLVRADYVADLPPSTKST